MIAPLLGVGSLNNSESWYESAADLGKPNEAMKLLANYERALKGYTYLQFNGNGTPRQA